MKIPNTTRKKALLIIDVTESFTLDRNKHIIANINKIIDNIDYDLYISSIPYNKDWSLWTTQTWWFHLLKESDKLDISLEQSLINKNHILVNKISKSIFKADINIEKILRENNIEEVHIVGYETNDCVMASAMESFDLWFYTFVIEEACETGSTAVNHSYATSILNYLKLTNNSKFVGYENTEFKIV